MQRSVEYFAPGERTAAIAPGDFILVHGLSFTPKAIRLGQRMRFRGARREFAFWNHAALYVGNGNLIEAKGHCRVRHIPLAQYDVRHYAVVRTGCEDMAMRQNAVKFARRQVGSGYGYLTILTLIAWSFTGGKLTIGLSGTNICSGLVARATERLGEIYDRDPETVMPADLAEAYGVGCPSSS
jgi:uncharacterized protein YycO